MEALSANPPSFNRRIVRTKDPFGRETEQEEIELVRDSPEEKEKANQELRDADETQ